VFQGRRQIDFLDEGKKLKYAVKSDDPLEYITSSKKLIEETKGQERKKSKKQQRKKERWSVDWERRSSCCWMRMILTCEDQSGGHRTSFSKNERS